jgi:uncharacterized protein YuzB (UPF0349 family)
MQNETHLDRKERLREQNKVELPRNIDDNKYLFANLSFKDIAMLIPAFLLTLLIIYVYYLITGSVNQIIIISALLPTLLMAVLQMNKHPERKNIPLWEHRIYWKFKFNIRQKEFYYSKGVGNMKNSKELSTQEKLPIKNIANGCIETKDNRLVKIIEVSSINLSLMNRADRKDVFESYQNFVNELEVKEFQTSQIAQPINLDYYAAWIAEKARDDRPALRKLKKAYLNQIDDIQKNKSMVTRKRYLTFSVPNNDSALDKVEIIANNIQFKLENMLSGSDKLRAIILKNDDLLKLIYTCVDFENAQSQGSSITDKAYVQAPIVLGEKSRKELEEAIAEHSATTFN